MAVKPLPMVSAKRKSGAKDTIAIPYDLINNAEFIMKISLILV